MNMAMQPPISYPFYPGSPRLPLSVPWSPVPFRFPPQQQHFPTPLFPNSPSSFLYRLPFILPQQKQQYQTPPALHSFSSYSNTRYNHLKQSTTNTNRRLTPRYSSNDESNSIHHYRPSKAKSVSDLQEFDDNAHKLVRQTHAKSSALLPKAHSWHSIARPGEHQHRPRNLSVVYANELQAKGQLRHRQNRSPTKKTHQRGRSSSRRRRRQRPMPIPERGVVRISTLDEMPMSKIGEAHKRSVSREDSKDIQRTTTRQKPISKERHQQADCSVTSSTTTKRQLKKNQNQEEEDEGTRMEFDRESQSSSSHSSLQQRLNGSLRNDPLLIAAMEDLREIRGTSLTRHHRRRHRHHHHHRRDLSRDSLCSDSTFQSSSTTAADNHSQSSFTSIERSEIRRLIKTIKHRGTRSLILPLTVSSTDPIVSEPSSSSSKTNHSAMSVGSKTKQEKSSITAELDREFTKLRARDPDQELIYVAPSAISKRKQPFRIPSGLVSKKISPTKSISPSPTFSERLRSVQLRPIEKQTTPEKKIELSTYENPFSPTIAVPQSSPIPPLSSVDNNESEQKSAILIPEYATPLKKANSDLPLHISRFQPSLHSAKDEHYMRSFSFCKPLMDINRETQPPPSARQSRPISMFNWLHCGLTNPLPTTFQPYRTGTSSNHSESITALVTENIYASEVDVHVPTMDEKIDFNKNENLLQMHLNDRTIVTDDFYADFESKHSTNNNNSSFLTDLSRMFLRHGSHQHERKCKVKNKSTKHLTNSSSSSNTARCSIM